MKTLLLTLLAVGNARRNKKSMDGNHAVHNSSARQTGNGGAGYYPYDNSPSGFTTTNYDFAYTKSKGHCKLVAGCYPQQPVFPILKGDCNPIGIGNIHGAYGLFVQIFGTGSDNQLERRIKVSDVERLVMDRRFPRYYNFPGTLRGTPLRVAPGVGRRRNSAARLTQSATRFNEPEARNVFLIICPFLSTLVNEGVLPLQQAYSRQLLEEVTIEAGLDPEAAEEHVAENFANRGNGEDIGEEDLFNLEGAQNEHQQSTGINDCTTEFVECVDKTNSFDIGTVERPFERCVFTLSDCQLPRRDIWNEFVDVVDSGYTKDGYFTVDELNEAAKRSCTFDKPSAR